MTSNFSEKASFLWSVADLLRGPYKPYEYGEVILPFTVIRRLDCVLEPSKNEVLQEYESRRNSGIKDLSPFLLKVSGQKFYSVSRFTFPKLLDDPQHIRQNLESYLGDFSENARDIFERFKFNEQIATLDNKNLLFMIVQKFATIDLHPDKVPNEEMGLIFEELIRKFSEASNEKAGEHFTPREVIRLMVNILFIADDEALSKPGAVRSLYDPAAGTGGMLSVAEDYLREHNPEMHLTVFGQELNDKSYSICKADMMIKGQDPNRIANGDSFTQDAFPKEKFDYMLSNPPFGVDWKQYQDFIRNEYERKGYGGRFGPGLPRVSDGSLLFLLHLLSKMRPPDEGGSRIGIVLNGSPLFTGDAGSGESEIRRWILENDWLEAIIAMPTELFYNTGIATYVWILSNRKASERTNKVQLINAVGLYAKMRKSLGNKRNYLTDENIREITLAYGAFEYKGISKIFDTQDFGFRKITIDRPPSSGKTVKTKKGQKPYDPDLRDTENVPLKEDIYQYFEREVKPHLPDAWINEEIRDEKDGKVGKVGYEINFNRYFYVYKPPRPLEEIRNELKTVESRIIELLKQITGQSPIWLQIDCPERLNN
ncbi:MAG: type I restriction-modification system subunit M [Leptospirales bacterium]